MVITRSVYVISARATWVTRPLTWLVGYEACTGYRALPPWFDTTPRQGINEKECPVLKSHASASFMQIQPGSQSRKILLTETVKLAPDLHAEKQRGQYTPGVKCVMVAT